MNALILSKNINVHIFNKHVNVISDVIFCPYVFCVYKEPVFVGSVIVMTLIHLETGETFMETPASVMTGTALQHTTDTQMTSAQVSQVTIV